MKHKTKFLKYIIIVVIIAAPIFLLRYLEIGTVRSATRLGYSGNDSGWSSWSASYTLLDGWMRHTIRPKTDTLHVEVITKSGTISIEMKDADGNVIFSGNNIETSSFQVEVPKKVVIRIEADHHKGSFDISSIEEED